MKIIDNNWRVIETTTQACEDCIRIANMPSVYPTRPTGKWIDVGNEGLVFKCPLCGYKNTIESHFCPNCGAKMEEVKI